MLRVSRALPSPIYSLPLYNLPGWQVYPGFDLCQQAYDSQICITNMELYAKILGLCTINRHLSCFPSLHPYQWHITKVIKLEVIPSFPNSQTFPLHEFPILAGFLTIMSVLSKFSIATATILVLVLIISCQGHWNSVLTSFSSSKMPSLFHLSIILLLDTLS